MSGNKDYKQIKNNFKTCVNQGKTVYSIEARILNLSTTNVDIEAKLDVLGRPGTKSGIRKRRLLYGHERTRLYSPPGADKF